jgi:hypothetical protein
MANRFMDMLGIVLLICLRAPVIIPNCTHIKNWIKITQKAVSSTNVTAKFDSEAV